MNLFKNWLDGLNFLFYMTQRIEPFFLILLKGLDGFLIFKPFSTISLTNDWPCFEHDSQNWTFLFKMSQRIEHMTWLKVLIELLKNITQRIECFFEYDSQNWTTHFEYDSKNWTFLSIFVFFNKITDLNPFQHGSEKMNRISKIWLKELNPLHKRTQRIGP